VKREQQHSTVREERLKRQRSIQEERVNKREDKEMLKQDKKRHIPRWEDEREEASVLWCQTCPHPNSNDATKE
jgi:hypothetical protein